MERDRWQRLQGLFLDLLEAEPGERQNLLEGEVGDDESLKRELLEMLRAHEDDAQLKIEERILEAQKLADGDLEGRRIGAYEVQRKVGSGGMGTVYLAERVDEYKQRVALKVMRSGLGGRESVQRFRRERQILARLTHPNIARILDGGMTEDGRPFLVMPYVEGLTVTDYCEANGLKIRCPQGRVGSTPTSGTTP